MTIADEWPECWSLEELQEVDELAARRVPPALREEDFPLVCPGFRYMVPPDIPEEQVGFIRFLDHRGMLRGLGFGPEVDIMVMAEQIEYALGVRTQFCPPGQQHFYSLKG